MDVRAISPISGGNDNRENHEEKRLIFKIGKFIRTGSTTNNFDPS